MWEESKEWTQPQHLTITAKNLPERFQLQHLPSFTGSLCLVQLIVQAAVSTCKDTSVPAEDTPHYLDRASRAYIDRLETGRGPLGRVGTPSPEPVKVTS